MSTTSTSAPARCGHRRAARLRERLAGEDGFAAGAEALIFGVLIFVIGTLIVANAWGAIDAKFATSAAAREATRAAVQASSTSEVLPAASAAATSALEGHGRADNPGFSITGVSANDLARCGEMGFEVQLEVPIFSMPGIDRALGGYTVRSEHRELVDPYRAGLPVDDGGVDC